MMRGGKKSWQCLSAGFHLRRRQSRRSPGIWTLSCTHGSKSEVRAARYGP